MIAPVPTVFVVQQPFRDLDLSPALEFGRVEYLLEDSDTHPRDRQLKHDTWRAQTEMEFRLQRFHADRDYLLLLGDPAAIALAAAIVTAKNGGKFTMLKYDRETKKYYPVFVNLRKERR